jgi:hypothetical protein
MSAKRRGNNRGGTAGLVAGQAVRTGEKEILAKGRVP